MSNYLCVPNLVRINVLQPKIFNILLFLALYLKKNTAAAAAVLQLQQQNLFELIQNIKLRMCTRFTENKWTYIWNIIQFVAAAAAAVLQLHGCSCSSSTLLDRFRMSNNPCVWSLVIINALFPKLFNLFLLPALYSQKVLQLQQWKFFWNHDLNPHTKWGKVNNFQKKMRYFLVSFAKNRADWWTYRWRDR